jgi:AraC-like DNA-binding protein
MLIVIGFSALLLTAYFNNVLSKEIETSNSRFLNQIRITADAHLTKIQSAVVEQFADIYNQDGIARFFDGSNDYEVGMIIRTFGTISEMKSTYSFVDSIYLYRSIDDTLISSREGIVLNASQPDNYNRNYINSAAVSRAMASANNMEWISPADNHIVWKSPMPLLTLVLSVPIFADAENKTGSIIVNINEKAFLDSINLYQEGYELMIVSQSHSVMAHSDSKKLLLPIESFSFNPLVWEQNEGFTTIQGDTRVMGMSWVQSSINGWKYVAIAPLEAFTNQLSTAKKIAFFIVSIFVVFALLGLALLTSRIYRPIRQFITSATRQYNVQYDNSNELTFFNKIMTNLSARVVDMESTLLQNQAIIRHKIVSDIILGHNACEQEVLEKLQVSGKSLPYDGYSILVTEYNPQLFNQLLPEQREYVIYRTIEILELYLVTGCTALSISVTQGQVVTLVNMHKDGDLEPELNRLNQLCKDDLMIACNMAISDTTSFLHEANWLYATTVQYLKYGFIYGYGNVFSSKLIQQIADNKKLLDKSELEGLVPLLKAYKKTQVEDQLVKILDFLQNELLQLLYVQNILAQIVAMIGDAAEDHHVGHEELRKDMLLDVLQSKCNLNECRSWLLQVVRLYGEQVSQRIGSIDDVFVDKIAAYITDNIDKDISLKGIADHFNISPNHLSRVFKNSTGVGFANYVIDHKLQKARDLLLSANKMKIEDIAASLGYFNVPYFRAIFKEKYGVSPVQYRKENLYK